METGSRHSPEPDGPHRSIVVERRRRFRSTTVTVIKVSAGFTINNNPNPAAQQP